MLSVAQRIINGMLSLNISYTYYRTVFLFTALRMGIGVLGILIIGATTNDDCGMFLLGSRQD